MRTHEMNKQTIMNDLWKPALKLVHRVKSESDLSTSSNVIVSLFTFNYNCIGAQGNLQLIREIEQNIKKN